LFTAQFHSDNIADWVVPVKVGSCFRNLTGHPAKPSLELFDAIPVDNKPKAPQGMGLPAMNYTARGLKRDVAALARVRECPRSGERGYAEHVSFMPARGIVPSFEYDAFGCHLVVFFARTP